MEMNEQLLKEAGQVITKQSGEVIFRSGDAGEDMYVVLKGSVNIFLEQNGSSIPVARLRQGDFLAKCLYWKACRAVVLRLWIKPASLSCLVRIRSAS